MNNKRLGTQFEREVCDILNRDGWWVHFISPDMKGAQPFDIIACKNARCFAADCKTSKDHIFRMDRLEWNQVLAFDKWIECGNKMPILLVKFEDRIKIVPYLDLKFSGKIDLRKCFDFSDSVLGAW